MQASETDIGSIDRITVDPWKSGSPNRTSNPARPSAWSALPLALWVAIIGPLCWSLGQWDGRPRLLAFIGGVFTVAALATPRRRWWLRLALSLLAAAAVGRYQGSETAAWLALGVLLGPWVAADLPPLPLPRPGPGATGPVAVLCAVAGWRGFTGAPDWQVLVPLGLATAMPLLTRLGGGALERIADRVGHSVSTAVSAVGFWTVGLALVVGPALLHQATRTDPLRRSDGWDARDRRALRPRQPWTADAAPSPAGHRAALALAALSAIAVLLVVGALTREKSPPPATIVGQVESPPGPSGAEGDTGGWYGEYREDIEWVLDERIALRPLEIYRLRDVTTRHVNIRGGYRTSWMPPRCDCPGLRVWVYGGSAAFGLEQRDDHTIASELSREADRRGIRLEVSNRGIPGQLHWRSALRFQWDLIHEPAPDLVVFYEGAEDVDAGIELSDRGLGDVRAPYEPYIERTYDEIQGVTDTLPPPPGVDYLGWPLVSDPATQSVGALVARRYERSREMSRNAAADANVPVVYVWHPATTARGDGGDRRVEVHREAAAALPADVIDLSSLFDSADGVEVVGGVHPDERGARLVATTLLEELVELDLVPPTGGEA